MKPLIVIPAFALLGLAPPPDGSAPSTSEALPVQDRPTAPSLLQRYQRPAPRIIIDRDRISTSFRRAVERPCDNHVYQAERGDENSPPPPPLRNLNELPDAETLLAVWETDGNGCPVLVRMTRER